VENKDMLAENLEKWAQQERQAGRQEERQKAEQRALEEKRATVRHLLAFGVLSDEQIAEATGLELDEIAKLRIEDKH
jgi:predicted transposase YdaD